MNYYEVICLFSYDIPHRYVVKASNKTKSKILGKVLCATKNNEFEPDILTKQLKVKGNGSKLFRINYYKDNYIKERYIKADNKSDLKIRFKNIANYINITEVNLYDENLLDSDECKDIDKVVVFWKVGNDMVKEIFETIDEFDKYANDNMLYYNCENSIILKNNMLVGLIYNKYKMINYDKLKEEIKK